MRNKTLTTRTGWLTAEGLRAGHAESFAAGYQRATMIMKTEAAQVERIVVTAVFSVDAEFVARYTPDQMNLARKSFVLICKVIDPAYKHEPVRL